MAAVLARRDVAPAVPRPCSPADASPRTPACEARYAVSRGPGIGSANRGVTLRIRMELNEILQSRCAGASDIHLKAGLPPMFRVDGSLVPLKDARRMPPGGIGNAGIINDQKEKYKQTNEVDLAYGVPGLGRFRVNVFQQRGTFGVVLRVIP